MTKKILTIVAALAMAAMTFTACGGNSENTEVSDTTASVTESVLESEETELVTEDTAEDIIPEDEEGIGDVDIEDEIIDAPVSDNPLMPIVDAALASSEWPVMEEVTDTMMLTEFFTLDPENANYKEFIVMKCPMSAVMSEIIIINAEDVEAAKADLEARKTKAIEIDAWYPQDQENAAASIVGTNGSYAFFIIGTNAADAETAINDYISTL